MGCDAGTILSGALLGISIHAPAWGATVNDMAAIDTDGFQSTHPRGVRLRTVEIRIDDEISIHAPAWGATESLKTMIRLRRFQSTHPRGVRPTDTLLNRTDEIDFNPRTRVGCDDSSVRICSSSRFQSTHPRGVRLLCLRDDRPIRQFQSTHPRGVRLRCRQFRCRTCNFNPRTRVGCDIQNDASCFRSEISIHAPAWGATRLAVLLFHSITNFNPRTRVGCDSFYNLDHETAFEFQSTHPRGVRLFPT